MVENKIRQAAAGVEANIERFIALDKGSEEIGQHLDAFERNEPPLARETTLAFLAGTALVALLVAAGTWLLLSEPSPSVPKASPAAAEERAAERR